MKMKSLKTISGLFAIVMISSAIFYSFDVRASNEPAGKKKLEACTVTSGGTVTMIGNTCEGSGKGCVPNPCY